MSYTRWVDSDWYTYPTTERGGDEYNDSALACDLVGDGHVTLSPNEARAFATMTPEARLARIHNGAPEATAEHVEELVWICAEYVADVDARDWLR